MLASEIEYIIVHCSDSPQGRGDTAMDMHRWHLANGWDGIGYHRVILESGQIENGRPLYWVGSHARGYNSKSIGVCLMGDGVYTLEQFKSLRKLIFRLLDRSPNAKVIGHCDVDSKKECPKFDVKAWWSDDV